MTGAVRQVTQKIARDMIALAQAILEDDSISVNRKVNINTLKDSALRRDLEAIVEERGDPVIKALFNNYVVYLEWDRPERYGKKPPIDSLRQWAEADGIPTDASTLWAISTAIWRDGHQGRPIFATMDNNIDRLFDEDWSDELFEAITNDLDEFFKN